MFNGFFPLEKSLSLSCEEWEAKTFLEKNLSLHFLLRYFQQPLSFNLVPKGVMLCTSNKGVCELRSAPFQCFGSKQVVLPLQGFYALLSQVSKIELYVRFVIFSLQNIVTDFMSNKNI